MKTHPHRREFRIETLPSKTILGVLLLVVAGIAPVFGASANHPRAENAVITLEGETATYTGKITADGVERFMNTVRDKKVSVLVISSSGGEINVGMDMGEWVYDHQVDVVVERMCMSSCANYVFTAGRRKTIRSDSIVAWHGSVLQQSGMSDADVRAATISAYHRLPDAEKTRIDLEVLIRGNIRKLQDYRAAGMERQAEFFSKIGVDEYICRVGNEACGAKDFFALSVKDMARFGVCNVTAPENYTEVDLTPYRRKGRSVEFVRLDLQRKH